MTKIRFPRHRAWRLPDADADLQPVAVVCTGQDGVLFALISSLLSSSEVLLHLFFFTSPSHSSLNPHSVFFVVLTFSMREKNYPRVMRTSCISYLEVQLGRVRYDGRGDEHVHLGPRQDWVRIPLDVLKRFPNLPTLAPLQSKRCVAHAFDPSTLF